MQTEEIADLNDEVSRLRALVTMLRSDAGIVNSQTVRSALQVNADMWDSLMNTTQRRIERLQNAVQRENARLQIERHSQTPSSSVH
jgi:ABC-type Na+ transport system ATPase subunit NatA